MTAPEQCVERERMPASMFGKPGSAWRKNRVNRFGRHYVDAVVKLRVSLGTYDARSAVLDLK